MNSVAQESPAVVALTMLTGLIVFILAMAVIFSAIYTLLHTGQSILGEITPATVGWFYP